MRNRKIFRLHQGRLRRVNDVQRIRRHSLVPGDIPVYGYIYDVKTGKLIEVPEAAAAGEGTASRFPIHFICPDGG